MPEVMARGPNFVFAQEFIRQQHGSRVWEKVLDELPAEAAETWRAVLLVTGSYPFSHFKAMLAALARVVGQQTDGETARMYEFIADRSLSTVHKFFFRFAEPAFVIKRYPLLWQRFFESGAVHVAKAGKGEAQLVFELPEVFLDWLPPACLGFSSKAVEMAGGSGLELQETEREARGEDQWRIGFRLRWEE